VSLLVCLHNCPSVCLYVCLFVCLPACLCVCMCVSVCVYMYVFVCVCVPLCLQYNYGPHISTCPFLSLIRLVSLRACLPNFPPFCGVCLYVTLCLCLSACNLCTYRAEERRSSNVRKSSYAAFFDLLRKQQTTHYMLYVWLCVFLCLYLCVPVFLCMCSGQIV